MQLENNFLNVYLMTAQSSNWLVSEVSKISLYPAKGKPWERALITSLGEADIFHVLSSKALWLLAGPVGWCVHHWGWVQSPSSRSKAFSSFQPNVVLASPKGGLSLPLKGWPVCCVQMWPESLLVHYSQAPFSFLLHILAQTVFKMRPAACQSAYCWEGRPTPLWLC